MKIEKPMLAASLKEEDFSNVPFPVYSTPKLDGIRCYIRDGIATTRNGKRIPNKKSAEWLEASYPNGFDGELIVKGMFNKIQSDLMTIDGFPKVKYYVFDYLCGDYNYIDRLQELIRCKRFKDKNLILVLPKKINNIKELLSFEKLCLSQGYEGIMLRTGDSPYKFGRSTLKEFYLVKFKRFIDSEAKIIGFIELMKNENKATKDLYGYTKRSSHKAKMKTMGMLGAIIVKDIKNSKIFMVGSGFNNILKREIWDNQKKYKGKIVTYKYQKFGMKNLPRFPVFKGFREDL